MAADREEVYWFARDLADIFDILYMVEKFDSIILWRCKRGTARKNPCVP